MSLIKVSSEELSMLSSQCAAAASAIAEQYTTLGGQVAAVAEVEWQGVAATQFNGLFTEWKTAAANMEQALSGISTMLSTAGSNYQSTEDANASMLSAR